MAKDDIKNILEAGKSIAKNKKFQVGLIVVLFLIILFSSTAMRLSNLPILKDVTTGKYIPADPDACYELRVAQKLLDTGNINGIDTMRNPGLNLTYSQEMLPKMLAMAYKTLHLFGSTISLDKLASDLIFYTPAPKALFFFSVPAITP